MAQNVAQTAIEGLFASCYIYVLFLIISSKAKTFKNAFYTIFVATGITDIASLFTGCFLRLNRELGLGEEYRIVLLACYIFSGSAFIAHLIGNILITINRYSALCLLNKYDSIWTKKNVWAAIAIQYMLSFAVFAHTIGTEMIYVRSSDGSVIFKGFEKRVDMIIRSTYFIACAIYAIVCVCLNMGMLIEWKRLPKIDGSLKHRHHDKSLLLHAMVVFGCTMLMCAQQLTKAIAVYADMDELSTWASMQYSRINDVMVSVPPFSLLLLSSDLRQEILNSFRRNKNRSTVTISVAPLSSKKTVAGRT
uniref:Serpentine receptor class gamma n=1 Tax=Haemonchus contortus TaxID=6289 RepID=A0A7I4YGV1_HAECO